MKLRIGSKFLGTFDEDTGLDYWRVTGINRSSNMISIHSRGYTAMIRVERLMYDFVYQPRWWERKRFAAPVVFKNEEDSKVNRIKEILFDNALSKEDKLIEIHKEL